MFKPSEFDSTTPEMGFEGMSWDEIVEHSEPDPRQWWGDYIDTIEEAREYAMKAFH